MRYHAYSIINDKTEEYIADIYYTPETDTYDAELKTDSNEIPLMFGPPPFARKEHPESWCIKNFLTSRVLPPNRQFIKEMLAEEGLYEYNWKEMIKLNKGRTVTDSFRVETINSR